MPESISFSAILTTVGGIAMALLAWFVQRLLKQYDTEIKDGKADRTVIRSVIGETEKEIHQRIDSVERRAEQEFVRRQDLETLLAPLNVSLAKIEGELRDTIVLRQQLLEQGKQIEMLMQENQEFHKQTQAFWQDFSGPLQWAKRESEK